MNIIRVGADLLQTLQRHFSFPLLLKELTEAANRRRTYVLRIVYAVLLYGVFALVVPKEAWEEAERILQHPDVRTTFGQGRVVLQILFLLQCGGVVLFLPALMCGRITQEKERDSLVLLLLTDLRPWKIILEKYFSGLTVMLSFFLLGLPLAGVTYALGGLESKDIIWLAVSLLVMCLQIGALSLFCSVWCRTTVGAFLNTYLFGAVLYGGPILLVFAASAIFDLSYQVSSSLALAATALISPVAILRGELSFLSSTLPSAASAFVFLLLARIFLIPRATVPPSAFVRRLFERIDALMKRLNRATGGVIFWHGSGTLPKNEPVFWRETQRRILGRPHYLIRVLYAVEIPTLALTLLLALFQTFRDETFGLSVLLGVLSLLLLLVISVHAANTIVSERVNQSFDVLLTTPLSAREIVHQKERALWRLWLVVAAPLLTVMVCKACLEHGSRPMFSMAAYLICGVLLIAIYLPLITWISLWISLRVRTRFQAILAPLGFLVAWVALCPLLFYLSRHVELTSSPYWTALLLLSPASMAVLNEMRDWGNTVMNGEPMPFILLNASFYAFLAFAVRHHLLTRADRCLRR